MKRDMVFLGLWTIVLLGLLLGPIGDISRSIPGGFSHWDKVAHFGLFGATGLVAVYCTRFLLSPRMRILFGLLFGLFLAVSSESAQRLLTYRTTSFTDLLAGVAGLSLGLLVYSLLRLR